MAEGHELHGFARFVAQRLVPGWENPRRAEVAVRLGIVAMSFAIIVNTVLFGFKLGFGLYVGSLALLADALDTLGDIMLDVVGLIALRVSLRAPDPEHPYGHERAEEIGSLAVATVLVMVGLQFGVEAGRTLASGETRGFYSHAALAVALFGVLGKAAISRFSHAIAHATGSELVRASAWHNATDVASGLLAAVAIGGRAFGVFWLDAAIAILIAGLVAFVGLRIFRVSSSILIGRGGTPEHVDEIHRVACGTTGVVGCSDIEVHWYGRKRRISLRIQVRDTLSLREAHDIADQVERALHGLHADWEPIIHVDPVQGSDPRGAHTPDALTQ